MLTLKYTYYLRPWHQNSKYIQNNSDKFMNARSKLANKGEMSAV